MFHDCARHCSELTARFETKLSAEGLGARAFQCGFRRRQGARMISDGEVRACGACAASASAAAIGNATRIRSGFSIVGLRMKSSPEPGDASMLSGEETPEVRVARCFEARTTRRFTDPATAASLFGPH